MRKIKLTVESLDVHSFATSQVTILAGGTVQGRQWSMTDCPDSDSYGQVCVCMPMFEPEPTSDC